MPATLAELAHVNPPNSRRSADWCTAPPLSTRKRARETANSGEAENQFHCPIEDLSPSDKQLQVAEDVEPADRHVVADLDRRDAHRETATDTNVAADCAPSHRRSWFLMADGGQSQTA